MRLIDADKLREEWVKHLHIPNPDSYFAVEQEITSECIGTFIQSIDEQPTVEAEPIKHAHLVPSVVFDGVSFCSECRKHLDDTANYCEWCGAKMDGDAKK